MKQKSDYSKKSYERGKLRALYILGKSDKTESEIRTKLKKNEYTDDIIDKIILFLKEYGYVDDQKFAFNYVSEKSNYKSLMQIRSALILKGVSVSFIEEAFLENNNDQSDLIRKLVEKKKIEWETADKFQIQKLYSYLCRKGFKSSEIISIIREFQGDIK